MLSKILRSILIPLNSASAWFLDKLSRLVKVWLASVREHSNPLYHDYIEGMLSDWAEVREAWRSKNYADVRIILASIPYGFDITLGICHLTFNRFRRAFSLFFYGTEQVLSLTHSLKPLSKSALRLRRVFSLLHWLTGSAGMHVDRVELRLSPTAQVTAWGEGAEATFGFTREGILGREAVGTFIPEIESRGRTLTELIREVCSSPEAYTLNVNENQACDGTRYWVFWVNVPVYSETGELIEISCIGLKTEDPELMQLLIREVYQQR